MDSLRSKKDNLRHIGMLSAYAPTPFRDPALILLELS
ncbi:hypothetical protein CoNPh23_CDS0062 [Staphylococcus phage S-CoN_Ph23]|nr:hypothetical protein CoNPh18_CDS0044 [Staphylococcus phage S-CoN_Ph18]WNM54615.1 hypothetical protein CoNPh19_CDS0068 [Staphylococcus phage S-CoN_Ph19]WNM54662.1 hypothetical protein CoNPh20_CDS0036 [Staphylococcus phage S-CoN_Ph20]WNM54784.1 hypothetical protein CoNPh21_CDS0075 [Staphylococcus phage S-CoN_Ph21]WNM54856.1 hypothetical protein CoNPh22_CDS0072 [Staphylococcus phage S-CoN_Ph22]WNM54925.1 hypothetical protein CoNPh23_CDS0062 [Staphylococcus phage S-CoN_Ph23]WNM54968.1 hypothet